MQLISGTTGSASGSPQHCISSIVNSVNYIFIFTLYITVLYIIHIVEVLHSHTTLLSHWPSGSTVCFPPRGAAFRAPGVHPHFWKLGSPDSMSRYNMYTIFFTVQNDHIWTLCLAELMSLYCFIWLIYSCLADLIITDVSWMQVRSS
jgi:hypothetical protein